MPVSVLAALPISHETDIFGNILGGGLLYTFQAGSSLPLATFQDVQCTIPNTNPVVLDGSGRAIVRYLQGQAYKLKLTMPDSAPGAGDGTVIWTVDNFWPPSAMLLSIVPQYQQTQNENTAGVVPVNTSFAPGHVKRYGAVGDGLTNDRLAIQNAFAAGIAGDGPVVFDNGATYALGPSASGESIITLTAPTNLTVYGNHATLVANTTTFGSQPRILNIVDPQDISIYDLNGTDSGANISVDWQGAWLFWFNTGGTSGQCGDILLSDCAGTNLVGFVGFFGPGGKRIRDISIISGSAKNCYYGLSCQENGDAIFADIRTWNCRRSYFPYGITGHTVNLDIFNDSTALGAATCCLIKRYQFDTKNIKLRASFSGSIVHSSLVALEHQPTGSVGAMEDIQLEVNVCNILPAHNNSNAVRFTSLLTSGVEETVTTLNTWTNIGIGGNFWSQNQGAGSNAAISFGVSPLTAADVWFSPQASILKTHQSGKNNWVFRWSPISESRFAYGDLTATTVLLPLPGWQSFGFTLKTKIWMHDAIANLATENVTYQENIITGFNSSADVVSILKNDTTLSHTQGTGGTIIFTPSGQNINVTFSGSPYAVPTANCRVDVEYISLTHP